MSLLDDGPRWQDDSQVTSCFLCNSKYTFFNRRHHCRKCGRVVCGKCSEQPIKYFPNTIIVNGSNYRSRSSQYETYRTCDECVEEIRMIKRVLFDNGGIDLESDPAVSRGSTVSSNSAANSIGNEDPSVDDSSTTKYSATTSTRLIRSSTDSSMNLPRENRHNRSHRDNDSDINLCPVCATDLLKQYIHEHKKKMDEISNDDFEMFREAHINECLIAYDFSLDHQRFNSPTQSKAKKHPRNKMLVYNMPPIPKPKYESIPNVAGGSYDTIRQTQNNSQDANSIAISSQTDAVVGSLTSIVTINQSSEKQNDESLDNECVICLEELKSGDKVGRLECLCVFHYKCIKDWFAKKGYGECPVHFFHQ